MQPARYIALANGVASTSRRITTFHLTRCIAAVRVRFAWQHSLVRFSPLPSTMARAPCAGSGYSNYAPQSSIKTLWSIRLLVLSTAVDAEYLSVRAVCAPHMSKPHYVTPSSTSCPSGAGVMSPHFQHQISMRPHRSLHPIPIAGYCILHQI
ncbi:hypothetical protein CC78DRAFT_580333 [Lojkania enalia]|uniref:Uncharacterized protein n=1 Tax=Lojkania enalia TaxID=147567 RepID=A0A9P4K9H5_9PLEO|nr:hypothetical protein CC78DRAFT_580333 [Didymosphaeria enalia]